MAVEIVNGVVQGFATGIGVGLANWFLIKRLGSLEHRVRGKLNGRNIQTSG